MPFSQKLFALLICFIVFAVTVAMVRRRQLREEYSVLWLATSLVMFVLVLRYDWLVTLTDLIGAALPTTTLFLGAIIFLMLIVMQFSIKLSELSDKVKNLAQENALLRGELQRVVKVRETAGEGDVSP